MNNNMNPENQDLNQVEAEAPQQDAGAGSSPYQQQATGGQTNGGFNPYQQGANGQPHGGFNPYQQGAQSQFQQGFYQQPNFVDESGLFSENKMARINGTSANVKIGDWMKADCLSFLSLIPCIGSIAYIVIYCILAFSSKTNKSMKTRYQANLIWAAIFLGIYIILLVVIVAVGGSLLSSIMDGAGLTKY